MRRMVILCLAAVLLSAGGGVAAPSVVTDIRPVHGLVAAIMDGAGAPTLLDDTGGSPHAAALRPASARALQEADIVVWIGPRLTPWIARAARTIAPDATYLTLLDLPGTRTLNARTAHDHDGDGDAHGAVIDPHVWLDPRNAAAWTGPVADALAAADPPNAGLYRANAARLAEDLAALEAALRADLAPVADVPFAVVHDAFAYFEHRFGLRQVGALSLSDAAAPGPQALRALRAEIAATGAVCLFVEPTTQPDLIRAVTDGQDLRATVLDPLGTGLPPGPDHYQATLAAIGRQMAGCLAR